MIYRHGLRVSEACDLRWDDIDLAKRTILVRRLKGSHDSTHYLERDELTGLKRLQREQEPNSAYVFVNERGQPFGRFGIGRMIERAGEAAGLPFPVHVHMLRHATGYALAARGMDTRRLQISSGTPASPTQCAIRPCRRSPLRTCGASGNRGTLQRSPSTLADCSITFPGGRLRRSYRRLESGLYELQFNWRDCLRDKRVRSLFEIRRRQRQHRFNSRIMSQFRQASTVKCLSEAVLRSVQGRLAVHKHMLMPEPVSCPVAPTAQHKKLGPVFGNFTGGLRTCGASRPGVQPSSAVADKRRTLALLKDPSDV